MTNSKTKTKTNRKWRRSDPETLLRRGNIPWAELDRDTRGAIWRLRILEVTLGSRHISLGQSGITVGDILNSSDYNGDVFGSSAAAFTQDVAEFYLLRGDIPDPDPDEHSNLASYLTGGIKIVASRSAELLGQRAAAEDEEKARLDQAQDDRGRSTASGSQSLNRSAGTYQEDVGIAWQAATEADEAKRNSAVWTDHEDSSESDYQPTGARSLMWSAFWSAFNAKGNEQLTRELNLEDTDEARADYLRQAIQERTVEQASLLATLWRGATDFGTLYHSKECSCGVCELRRMELQDFGMDSDMAAYLGLSAHAGIPEDELEAVQAENDAQDQMNDHLPWQYGFRYLVCGTYRGTDTGRKRHQHAVTNWKASGHTEEDALSRWGRCPACIPAPTISTCKTCGNEYEKTHGSQKNCPECRK